MKIQLSLFWILKNADFVEPIILDIIKWSIHAYISSGLYCRLRNKRCISEVVIKYISFLSAPVFYRQLANVIFKLIYVFKLALFNWLDQTTLLDFFCVQIYTYLWPLAAGSYSHCWYSRRVWWYETLRGKSMDVTFGFGTESIRRHWSKTLLRLSVFEITCLPSGFNERPIDGFDANLINGPSTYTSDRG